MFCCNQLQASNPDGPVEHRLDVFARWINTNASNQASVPLSNEKCPFIAIQVHDHGIDRFYVALDGVERLSFLVSDWTCLRGMQIQATAKLLCESHGKAYIIRLYERASTASNRPVGTEPEPQVSYLRAPGSVNVDRVRSSSEASSSESKGKARAEPDQYLDPCLDDAPNLYLCSIGADLTNADNNTIKEASSLHVLTLIDLIQSKLAKIPSLDHSARAALSKAWIVQYLHDLANSVDRSFVGWMELLVIDAVVKYMVLCSPIMFEKTRESDISNAVRSVIEEMCISNNAECDISAVLVGVTRQNPNDEFLTSLVDSALDKLAAVARAKNSKTTTMEVVMRPAAIEKGESLDGVEDTEDMHRSLTSMTASLDLWTVIEGDSSEPQFPGI